MALHAWKVSEAFKKQAPGSSYVTGCYLAAQCSADTVSRIISQVNLHIILIL